MASQEMQTFETQPLSEDKNKDYYQVLLQKEKKIENLTKTRSYYRYCIGIGVIIVVALIITLLIIATESTDSTNSAPLYSRDETFFIGSRGKIITSLAINIWWTEELYASSSNQLFLFNTSTGELVSNSLVKIPDYYSSITSISFSSDNDNDANGLWIADQVLYTVTYYIIEDGTVIYELGTQNENGNSLDPVQFDKLSTVHFDVNGVIYVGDGYSDSINQRVIAYNRDDNIIQWNTPDEQFIDVYDITADSVRGWLWVSDRGDKSIKVFRMWLGNYLGKIDCLDVIGNYEGAASIKYYATLNWIFIGQQTNQLTIIDISDIGTNPTMIDLFECKEHVIFTQRLASNLQIEAIEVNLNNNDLYVAVSGDTNAASIIYRYVKN
eukprot:87551_1